MTEPENRELLDALIVGRVQPHIYAFSTNTIPNFLKVGDTYRPVSLRLREWMRRFPNLQKEYEETAAINDNIFFRDYSVHQYLEDDLGRRRLLPTEYPDAYYSNEFFKDALAEHIDAAILDIKDNYAKNTGKYTYYDASSHLPETFAYASTGEWEMRPNQAETVRRFIAAVDSGHTNLLMYAVMRFGKSFTALCCAKAKGYKTVLVVSAKADVREEWKRTVQSADNFNRDYAFISSEDLLRDEGILTSTLNGGHGAVIFLTLQDLQGNEIKAKHKDVLDRKIDLLIVDETHYGARAESYGKILRSSAYERDVREKHANDDFIEIEDAKEQLKSLSAKVTLHLSGTPYRILMGSEFSKEDIIAFYQFSDIAKDKEEWDREHLLNDEEDVREWDNPYYGFPQMIRFAFMPSKSALALLESLRGSGTDYAFSALLKPRSLRKDAEHSLHKKFVYEKEVLELFEAIDGSKDEDGLLPFLDYDKIKEGKMCQHIVCVLPYCASCDALEALIHDHSDDFKNLRDYAIINISGIDSPNEYGNVQAVKAKIRQCAAEGRKTLTLTVNRMLTGSTVEEWDAMIFLKDTASPQEYDQAAFRLQNPYIKEYREPGGDVIKFNMKPQTLLVDFDPHRMFLMQERRSQIYNANTDASGNARLRDRMEDELRISPIITLNKNRIERVRATDILAKISDYSNHRGVQDEALDIPIDLKLLDFDIIKNVIESQSELGSKHGFSMDAHEGDETDYESPDGNTGDGKMPRQDPDPSEKADDDATGESDDGKEEIRRLEGKFRTYYSRILFFAFLTKSSVASLDDVIFCLEDGENPRIAMNLGLKKDVLAQIREHMNIFILRQLDYKIQNMNMLAQDESIDPAQRAAIAMRKFGRISDSEITTPEAVAEGVTGLIPDECFIGLRDADARILDIASKMGEFAMAIVKRCDSLGIPLPDIKGKILSIPTSSVAYEFTRKVYEILGLDADCIAAQWNSYDLLKVKARNADGSESDTPDYAKIRNALSQKQALREISLFDERIPSGSGDGKEDDRMKFNAVVGNPPYQEADGGAGASSIPIYPNFVSIAETLKPNYVSIIIPTRWFTGGRHLEGFRKAMINDIHVKELHDCLHPEEIFPDTNNRGGICYFLWDIHYDNSCPAQVKVVTHDGKGEVTEAVRPLRTRDLDIFIRNANAISILDKVIPVNAEVDTMARHVSARKPFNIESNIVKTSDWHTEKAGLASPVACYGKRQTLGYVERNLVTKNADMIDRWKVFTPRANNVGTELSDDNLNTFLGAPGTICTEAYMAVGADLSLDERMARNLMSYFRTKFARFMHSLAKASHDATQITYRFVPTVDFSQDWTDEKLYATYGLTQAEIDLIESSIKPMT